MKDFKKELVGVSRGSFNKGKLKRDIEEVMRDVAEVLNGMRFETSFGCNGCFRSLTIRGGPSGCMVQTLFMWRFARNKVEVIVASGFLTGRKVVSSKRKEIEDAIVRWFGEKRKYLICIFPGSSPVHPASIVDGEWRTM